MTAPTADERAELDVNRLRNWARAYQRLMLGGLGKEAHTAGVDEFASDAGEYPYITAADVLALLDRLAAAEAKVAAVEALTERWTMEADERGPDDRVLTRGVAGMLRAALGADASGGGEGEG